MLTETLTPDAPASPSSLLRADRAPADWLISADPVLYEDALQAMRSRAAAIAAGEAPEAVWLLEHPPLYTRGTSAEADDLLDPGRFPVFDAGRGGEYTYHGPGQRVVYAMLDLRERGRDIRAYVQGLEAWLIDTLAAFDIFAERSTGRIGVWVPGAGPLGEERKIAAIGVRVSRWVSLHGIALNVSPDLSHFDGIVPCGIADRGVTSLEALGHIVSLPEVDSVLKTSFVRHFGPVKPIPDRSLV